ncbi:MAG: hypothetical protein II008_09740 [Oscillospiraceae bacterium]|nr:hypothetical protein [Oscillospiraceae bacterium]
MATTNGDRVRLMPDEKIADLMAGGCPPGMSYFHCDSIDPKFCAACWLRWLKKEAEG